MWDDDPEPEDTAWANHQRPLTDCPSCGGEIDLTWADPDDRLVCAGCGAELIVLSLDPPDVELADEA